jgi:MFS family permease
LNVLFELPRGVRWLLFANVLTFVGIGLTAQYSALYLTEGRGHTLATATAILSVGGLAGALITPVAGWFVDRFGTRIVALVSTVLWALMLAAYALVGSAAALMLCFVIAMLFMNVRFTAFGSAIGLLTKPALRAPAMSLNFAALNLGIGVGGLIAGFLLDRNNPSSYALLYLLQAIGVGTLLLFVQLLPERLQREAGTPTAVAASSGGFHEILSDRRLWWLSLIAMVMWFVIAQQNHLLPLLATRLGVSTQVLGIALVLNTFSIALLQMPAYRLVRDWPRTRTLQLLFAIMFAGWGLLWLGIQLNTPLWLAAMVIASPLLVGIGETLFSPTLPPTLMGIAPRPQLGRYNGLFTFAIATCNITAPLVTGIFVGNGWGTEAVLMLMALSVLGILLARRLPVVE